MKLPIFSNNITSESKSAVSTGPTVSAGPTQSDGPTKSDMSANTAPVTPATCRHEDLPSGSAILKIGLLAEALLASAYFAWQLYWARPLPTWPDWIDAYEGLSGALTMSLAASLLLWLTHYKPQYLPNTREFVRDLLVPLAKRLSPIQILVISLAAGIGEELFFRGILLPETGILCSSALFSLLHFGSAAWHYRQLALIYFVAGLYLGSLVEDYNNLWPAIIAHSIYDVFAFLLLRKMSETSPPEQK